MEKLKIVTSILILLSFVSCKQEIKQAESDTIVKSYFDLEAVVQRDINRNIKNKVSEEKIINANNKHEQQIIKQVDWKKEMQLLLECDINKSSWKGKFDSIVSEDKLKYIYIANSTKIPVSKMTITYADKDSIMSVVIDKKISTLLFSNEQQIIYFPGKSFKINSKQSAIFMEDFNSEVEIKYLYNQ